MRLSPAVSIRIAGGTGTMTSSDHKDEGKVGYYLFDCEREESVPVTRAQAEALYTLAYPMTWEDWDKENHELCMCYA
jgi:hypothetical protein